MPLHCSSSANKQHPQKAFSLVRRSDFLANRILQKQLLGNLEWNVTCMTSLRMGVECRKSYSARDRSVEQLAKMSGSAGLKRTAVSVSAPQEKLLIGSDRLWSHMSTCTPKSNVIEPKLSGARQVVVQFPP